MPKIFPFYKQLDANDCGASCLRMIARYHGRYYSLDNLREMTYIGKQGVSLLGISDAAERIGFQTLAAKTSFERLRKDIPLPCIAHWNQQHFIVIHKVTDKFVWIADPAAGKFKLPREQFLSGWASDMANGEPAGILLLLETTPEFHRYDDEKVEKSGLGYVWSYFRKYSAFLTQIAAGLLIGTLLQIAFPFILKEVVDAGIQTEDTNFIYAAVLGLFVLFVSQIFVDYVRGWILLHVGARVNINLISDFLIKLTNLPLRYFDTKMTGDLLQRIFDHERLQRFLSSTSLFSVFSFFTFIAFFIVLAAWNFTVFLLFLVGTLLNVAWFYIFTTYRRDLDYARFDQATENQNKLMELISGMPDIKLHNAEKQRRWSWERMQAKLFRTGLDTMRVDQIQKTGAQFINEAKNLIIIFFVALQVVEGRMTLGMLVAVQYIIGQLNGPLNQFVDFIRSFQEARISLERMNEIHKKDNEERPEEKISFLPDWGDLVLDKVSFQYSGPHSPVVLKNIRMRIPRGKTTAIVGASGSGKTTLLKLLLNYYEPTEGAVRVGDVNISNIQNRLWRQKCGAVMQDGYIFNDTIARNIALGDDIIDKVRLLQAVKTANIQTHVESLPLGYNTRIGRDGQGHSLGQLQRILIARAVYKAPDYLFFDEATSALDAYNEMVIMENLQEFFKNKTMVIVAHRLSTVMNADYIIVLDSGEVVEQGTHGALTYKRGAYYHLVKNQLELGA
jgi:ATP-binding cassette, subfamily B, bacterial